MLSVAHHSGVQAPAAVVVAAVSVVADSCHPLIALVVVVSCHPPTALAVLEVAMARAVVSEGSTCQATSTAAARVVASEDSAHRAPNTAAARAVASEDSARLAPSTPAEVDASLLATPALHLRHFWLDPRL